MTIHADWLSLIEVSGAFLAEAVLDDAFPQGLEGLSTAKRQFFRRTYDEWREAQDTGDPQREELHQAWINWVLKIGLEWDEDGTEQDLKPASQLNEELILLLPEHGLTIKPDFALYADDRTKPYLVVQAYDSNVELNTVLGKDGWSTTPAERMSHLCKATGVRFGLITNGEQWIFVDAPAGGITSYATWYARLWSQESATLQAFYNLLSIRTLFNGFGTDAKKLSDLLDESLKHQDEVTETLGLQVQRAVEVLIQSLDRINNDRNGELLAGVEPSELYEAGLTYMMRLVFLLCAEERGLLLLGDETYESNYAVSTLRMKLREDAGQQGDNVLSHSYDAWSRLLALFRAVYGGIEHEELRMPAFGGSLFDPDRFSFFEGRPKGSDWRLDAASPLPIDNRTVLLFLDAIQIYQGRTLSYRALDVEQIGYVYEGLLEKTVIRADDVTLELNATQRSKRPWVTLSEIASAELEGDDKVIELLLDRTGSSKTRVLNDYRKLVESAQSAELLLVCNNNVELRDRLLPYFHFLREDAIGKPLVYAKNAFMVSRGQDRRDSGSHYTPKLLTEKIVRETLEPLVYDGVRSGKPREEWKLRSAQELLDLKICEPAMGSGSFLVQVCRWLGDRVVEAWQEEEFNGAVIDVDGVCHLAGASVELMPVDAEERVLIARRLVAERCIYGIDLNPQAVELAKLSVWLVTLAKDKPFGFLDHNLRWGDCLLGIHSLDQLTQLHPDPAKGNAVHDGLFDLRTKVQGSVSKALEARKQIRTRRIRDVKDIQVMASINESARGELEVCHRIADAMIGEMLANPDRVDLNMVSLAAEASEALDGNQDALISIVSKARPLLSVDLPTDKGARSPFHWPLEYPEVFESGGFDAIVGNPPYLGGQRITGALGTKYRDFLVSHIAGGVRGSADLVAYFFLHCHSLLKEGGLYGLLGVNTIAEGDTRVVGLEQLLGERGASIVSAYPNEAWPGSAAVVTSRVHLTKGGWKGQILLNGKPVEYVSVFLSDQEEWTPEKLKANEGQSFQGSIILGLGFTLSESEAQEMIASDSKNKEVLYAYLNGKDLNSHPRQQASRWVINFFDWPEERAKLFRDPYLKVFRDVKPERQKRKPDGEYKQRKPLPEKWWIYAEKRPALYRAIGSGGLFESQAKSLANKDLPLERVIVLGRVGKFLSPVFVETSGVFSDSLTIITSQSGFAFAALRSTFHEEWAWKQGSRMKRDLRYTPSDIYETFPFPRATDRSVLDMLGNDYHQARAEALIDRNTGLTKFYNFFHDPTCLDEDVSLLRSIRVNIDQALADAFGWDDLELDHGFHEVDYLPENDRVRFTFSRSVRIEILKRLSKLNRERYEEEVSSGLNTKKQSETAAASKKKTPVTKQINKVDAEAKQPASVHSQSATQGDMFGNPDDVATSSGNQWGSNAIDQILAWLDDKRDWYAKPAILAGCGAPESEWASAITTLLEDGDIKSKVVDGVTRYKAVEQVY